MPPLKYKRQQEERHLPHGVYITITLCSNYYLPVSLRYFAFVFSLLAQLLYTIVLTLVCLDYACHKFMANDILLRHFNKSYAINSLQYTLGFDKTAFCDNGKSICVRSPVTIILVFQPIRVRNIFICAEVVFCASSSITTASLSVRPRIKANGAI